MSNFPIFTGLYILFLLNSAVLAQNLENIIPKLPLLNSNSIFKSKLSNSIDDLTTPCTCGIFLEGQISDKGVVKNRENPIFSKSMDLPTFPCGIQGNKQCMKKCIDMMITFMPNIGPLVCSTIDRDCFKEKPYLFTKNCESTWRNTGFYAGKEFCCSNGLETKCRPGVTQKRQTQPVSLFDILNSSPDGKSVPDLFFKFVDKATDIANELINFAS